MRTSSSSGASRLAGQSSFRRRLLLQELYRGGPDVPAFMPGARTAFAIIAAQPEGGRRPQLRRIAGSGDAVRAVEGWTARTARLDHRFGSDHYPVLGTFKYK